ncbi:MAG: DMT family transporter [Proteobacteria bacterium]|nr:DMT family transporter [Pseudomonadota bacterium]MCL2307726.1 DMT family transporter [Pseudomonadota bacterium]
MSSLTLFVVTAIIWGATWLAITGQLGVVSPAVSVTYRFVIAAAILMLWCWQRGVPLRFPWRTHLGMAGQGACLFSLNYLCIYVAEQYISSGLVAILFSLLAVLNVLAARLLFSAPLTVRTVLAAVLGIGGVTLMFFPEFGMMNNHPEVLRGIAFGVLGALFACAGNMMAIHNQRTDVPVWSGAAWGMVYGAAISALVGLSIGVEWTFDARPMYIISLLYLSVLGTVVAFLCYLTLLKREGAGFASYINVVVPVVALLLSTLFEGYQWTAIAAVGATLALVGNFLTMRRGQR